MFYPLNRGVNAQLLHPLKPHSPFEGSLSKEDGPWTKTYNLRCLGKNQYLLEILLNFELIVFTRDQHTEI